MPIKKVKVLTGVIVDVSHIQNMVDVMSAVKAKLSITASNPYREPNETFTLWVPLKMALTTHKIPTEAADKRSTELRIRIRSLMLLAHANNRQNRMIMVASRARPSSCSETVLNRLSIRWKQK